jgi:hypothetical protein
MAKRSGVHYCTVAAAAGWAAGAVGEAAAGTAKDMGRCGVVDSSSPQDAGIDARELAALCFSRSIISLAEVDTF